MILPDGRMNVKDAALYLGLSEKTLAIWRSTGVGPPYIKLGKIFYFKDDLDSWIANARVTPDPLERRRK